MQLYTVYFICKLLYMFPLVSPPIIGSTNNCTYSIWYWSTVAATCRYRGVESQLLHDTDRQQQRLASTRCCRYSYLCS